MLNVRQVEIFQAVMECGSVSEAARRLHVSQPSVSKHLGLLESRLGLPLFLRRGNRLMPTREAVALQRQVAQLYTGLAKLDVFMRDLSQHRHGEIQIAAMPLIAYNWLPNVISPLLRTYTEMSASLPVRSSAWVCKWVAAGRADLGIAMADGAEDVVAEPLMDLPLVAIMTADHPLAARDTLCAEDFIGQSLITLSSFDYAPRFFDELLQTILSRCGRRIQTFTSHVACELARQELGVALVDALTATHIRDTVDGLCLRLVDEKPSIEISLISTTTWPQSALAGAFAGEIRAAAAVTMERIADLGRDAGALQGAGRPASASRRDRL